MVAHPAPPYFFSRMPDREPYDDDQPQTSYARGTCAQESPTDRAAAS
jgi:hypothetical protein